ncbi:MAG: TetR/AcrR family transcriptional regulator [Bacillota bacterium]
MAKPTNIDPLEIIKAAKICLQKKGIAATTLKDVAKLAGVAQGTVYYHFKTKEDLMLAVIQLTIDGHLKTMDRIWDNAEDLPSKVSSVIDATRDAYGKDYNFHRLILNMAAIAIHNGRADKEFSHQLEKVLALVEGFCQKLIKSDVFGSSTTKQMSRIILAVITGLALQSIFHKNMDIDGAYQCFKQMMSEYAREDTTAKTD